MSGAPGPARPGPLLRWGLPRDPSATTLIAGFLVATVATVLLVRAFLAAAGYRRFLERRLREDFDFPGTPIEISVRVREKRKR